MSTVVGVLAEAPIAGVCKEPLLAAHGPEWVSGLYAAMLRDVLDGAQALDAANYVVFAAPKPSAQEARESLVRHVPGPWKIVAQPTGDRGARIAHALGALLERAGDAPRRAVLLTADVPSFEVAALAAVAEGEDLAVAEAEGGVVWAIAASSLAAPRLDGVPWGTPAVAEALGAKARREVSTCYAVDAPSDVLRLVEELRAHPDRAPRSAHYLVTHA